jgi:hypothetical protein
MTRSVVVHGHFYQPPRENPWQGEVEAEPSAAPFHDWNARITHECYEPVSRARVLDEDGRVTEQANLFEWLSFDAGATLLVWLERHAPAVYERVLDGDRVSAARLGGHGNAIAMPYHHVILPLASRRDKVTELRWGLADFERRFGRAAEGVWLPETAADEETLVVLAEGGVRFTVLAPQQVEHAPASGEPLRFAAGGGRELAIFAYDGALAAGIAFGALLSDGDSLARSLAGEPHDGSAGPGARPVVSVATDGETFGHHHKFGEMGLARALALLRERPGVRVENFASLLARVPARRDAALVSPSSWSCPHGVGRWRANCGCRATPGTVQEWRGPLRAALDLLAARLDERIAADGGALFADWPRVLDEFGPLAQRADEVKRGFVANRLRAGADARRALRLLEGAHARFGMFGSCAWFFDDVGGHETVLMLRLAAYAIERVAGRGAALEEEFLAMLALAPSNDPAIGNGAAVYRALLRSAGERA